MTRTAHTPGPWHFHKMSKDGDEALISMGSHILEDANYSAWMLCRNEANACLIASAPELLEALEDAVFHLSVQNNLHKNSEGINHPVLIKSIEMGNAAIAKARGQE